MNEYRNLAYAVIRAAVKEYFHRLYSGTTLETAKHQLNIADIWFETAEINREWLMEKVERKGEEIWQKIQEKKKK